MSHVIDVAPKKRIATMPSDNALQSLKYGKTLTSLRSQLMNQNIREWLTWVFEKGTKEQCWTFCCALCGPGSDGEFKASKTILHYNISSPFAAEAKAGLEAIELVLLMGLTSAIIMGDSKTVIKKCQSIEVDKSVLGAIIRDIQSKRTRLQEVTFQFIHRSENTHAHKLAKEALEEGKNRT
ncbi:hypothetical protein CXB51_031048 [Gossypium anomalum]|uniref:RNase H type-1 domain-containing protein n=1 Tax=Gossypium anomalum TaxID=47600 RepID=A0A8J5XW49_9ROSI|nr:hypothetical protein CXB51_031048 [Gossypium anomalum]